MKKFIVLLLILVVCSNIWAQSGRTREREVKPSERSVKIAEPTKSQTSQSTAEIAGDDEVVKVDTALVTIPISVIDRKDRFVTNLRQEDFQVFENGKPQEVAYFAASEQPITVILLLDVSYSAKYDIDEIRNAASTFVRQLKLNDRVMVISFAEEIKILSEPTSDREKLFKAIQRAKIKDGTSLYDAVGFAINRQLQQIQGRKAIVLYTDGVDTTSSEATVESTLADAEESNAVIYPIQYNTYDENLDQGNQGFGTSREEYAIGAEYLQSLTDRTGGRIYQADSTKNLENAFFSIAEELRWQYNIGYYPTEPGKTGERRQIKVRTNLQNVAVRARDSYVVGERVGGAKQISN